VLSYLVTQRTKEIGIRVALGATIASVMGLVLRQSMRLTVAGAAAGAILAFGVSRVLASQVFFKFFMTLDGVAYGGGLLVVFTVSIAAAIVPSRRAARIDPITALRHD
jgi:putative ABC transport system permease protein